MLEIERQVRDALAQHYISTSVQLLDRVVPQLRTRQLEAS